MAEVTLPTGKDAAVGEPPAATQPPGAWREFWLYFRENRGAIGGLVFLGIIILCAIFAPFVAPHNPDEQFRTVLLQPPAWQQGARGHFRWVPTISAAMCFPGLSSAPASPCSSVWWW